MRRVWERPRDADAHLAAARFRRQTGDLTRAKAHLEQAVELRPGWSEAEQEAFEAFCRQAAVVLENAKLYDAQVQSRLELEVALAGGPGAGSPRAGRQGRSLSGALLHALQGLPDGARQLVHLLDTEEVKLEVEEHLARVGQWSLRLAAAAGLAPERQRRLAQAALLHDVGKLGLSRSLLQKPGILSAEERALLVQHVTKGVTLLSALDVGEAVVAIVAAHHERWDGLGYPHGLAGEAIPLEARILAIADSYDAMTTHRVYREALTVTEAVAELQREAGRQFDPHLADLFISFLSPAR